jgi:hypothetical protein
VSRLAAVRRFGSYARGTAHEESDVDCLVLLDHVAREDDRVITDLVGDLTWHADVVTSPLVMSVDRRPRYRQHVGATPLVLVRLQAEGPTIWHHRLTPQQPSSASDLRAILRAPSFDACPAGHAMTAKSCRESAEHFPAKAGHPHPPLPDTIAG